MSTVIEVRSLTHHYHGHEALRGVDFTVPAGSFYGLLGPNGAGKTTTLDILMNLLRPTAGEARVLGTPSPRIGPRELTRIGYASPEQNLPGWMTLERLYAYLAPLYPTWDTAFADRLTEQLALPRGRKISQMSRGERMKTALAAAMAFRPQVLILDEPFTGLDAIVRADLVTSLLDPAQREGWTVLLSSHDLEDIEPLVDRIGILNQGRTILDVTVEHLAERYRRVEAVFTDAVQAVSPLPESWRAWTVSGRTARFVDTDFTSEAEVRRRLPGAQHVEIAAISLRELFVTLCQGERRTEAA